MKYAQIVVGPAGSGKSTYCDSVRQHCEIVGRTVHVVNLDPAAEEFHYPVAFDIRNLISLEDVLEELHLGPNGGLLYCMEYLEDNLEDWLGEELEAYGDEDYLIFDCPGQIELYSHVPVMRSFVEYLGRQGYTMAVVYCLDAQFASDGSKFVAGSLQALSAMVQLELPHINVLTKVDLLAPDSKRVLDEFLFPEARLLAQQLNASTRPALQRLNDAIASLVDDWNLVSFLPLDYGEEDSMGDVLAQIDRTLQFGEDADVKTRDYDEQEAMMNDADPVDF
ncbi:hypothetical protein WJX73_009428 [Symbiochloris irregularis]|uniref:GPN-loop GTPase 3 n=1 Tax=Symbiochloris irregularis TaxID=706552 RepID=A0AAW1P5J6_9CHLO